MTALFCVLLLLLTAPVFAAPAVIGTPVMGNSGASSGTSLTISATCPSGNSNVVAVGCVATHKSSATAVTVDSVTWNGSGMTQVGAAIVDSASNGSFAQLFRHTSPTCDGNAHNYVITLSGSTFFITGGILFLKDTDTTSPHDTQATATNTTGPATVDVSSASGDLVVDCVAMRNSTANMVAGGGQVGITSETTNATASSNEEGGQSYEAGAATVTMSWTHNGTPSWAIVGVSFNPAPGTARRRAVPPQPYMRLFDFFAPLSPAVFVSP
jgi:hypothetical protein